MAALVGTLLGIVIVLVISALVIYIVSRLGLGLTVDSFGSAIIAALVIAVVAGIINWLLGLIGFTLQDNASLLGALVALIIAAIVLIISDRFLSGMKVNGFGGALIAAVAIGVVTWIFSWLINLVL